MQTIQFLETANWIISQFSKRTVGIVFQGEVLHMRKHDPERLDPRAVDLLLHASHEIATRRPELSVHPLAPEVLKAFGLGALLDEAFPVRLARTAVLIRQEMKAEPLPELLTSVMSGWKTLAACIDPIQEITTPSAIVGEKDFDEILTVELRYVKDYEPPVETISAVLKDVTVVYNDVVKLLGCKEAGKLATIYAASGSEVRFDFKGMAEPIKEIKNLLVEAWHKIRHRKAEDVQRHNATVLSTLDVLEEIKAKRDKKVISDEDAEKLGRKVINATLDLFRRGGLIREIRPEETVSNQKLMEGIGPQRLLPAAPEQLPEAKEAKKPAKKRKTKKKKVKKTAEESSQPSEEADQPDDEVAPD